MNDLTPRQAEVLHFVLNYVSKRGHSPTYREIGDGLGIRSTNAVSIQIWKLDRKGYVRIDTESRRVRAIELTDKARRLDTASFGPLAARVIKELRDENGLLKDKIRQIVSVIGEI